MRRASSRMSRRFSVRRSPSWRRAQSLDLVADFAIAGQIARLELAAGDAAGRLELRPEVLGFLPVVHQPGGLPGHPATHLVVRHDRVAPKQSPSMRRGAIELLRQSIHVRQPKVQVNGRVGEIVACHKNNCGKRIKGSAAGWLLLRVKVFLCHQQVLSHREKVAAAPMKGGACA